MGIKTSAFGTPGRINHDSTEFYNSKLYADKKVVKPTKFIENPIPPVSARSIGHPAPFPEELPYRLIQLYSFKGDVVLDPFCGSGTTCLAAIKTERNYIGYDIEKKYVKLAQDRISNHVDQLRIEM